MVRLPLLLSRFAVPLALLALALSSGCKSKSENRTGAGSRATDPMTKSAALDAGAGAEAGVIPKVEASDLDDNSNSNNDGGCFATCMRANQMRAVGIEQIERDCRADCTN